MQENIKDTMYKLSLKEHVRDGKNILSADISQCESETMGGISDGYHTFDELYSHRCALFALIMNLQPELAWWSKTHHDGEQWEGWVLCGLSLPTGDVSYHLPEDMLHLLPDELELPVGKVWDGHTSSDVISRLMNYIPTIEGATA